jgi:hypothetical protein
MFLKPREGLHSTRKRREYRRCRGRAGLDQQRSCRRDVAPARVINATAPRKENLAHSFGPDYHLGSHIDPKAC